MLNKFKLQFLGIGFVSTLHNNGENLIVSDNAG